jgi:hypothetical protein
MRFAYLTTDEVNQALTLEMALECGVTLYPLAPKDGPPDGSYDAVLCDWDSWPPAERAGFLAAMDGQPYRPAAVHSYDLDEDLVETLLRLGVAAYRNVQLEGLVRLCHAARLSRALIPSGHDLGVASPSA